MRTFIYGKWHAWEAVAGILLSDEDTKELSSFKNWDSCVNWLYLNGDKPAARALNNHLKQLEAKNAPSSS